MERGAQPFTSFPPVGENFPYYSWTYLPNTHLVDLIRKCHNRKDDVKVFGVCEPADHFRSIYPINQFEIDEWKDKDVNVIYGTSGKYEYENEFYEKEDGFKVFSPTRHFFPLYFLYYTFYHFTSRHTHPPLVTFTPTKHFTCYNFQPRPHRIILLHFLKQKGLLENNYYSFINHIFDRRVYNKYYNFNFYDFNVSRKLPEDINDVYESYYTFDTSFINSAFQVVSETTDNHIFLTEKTFYPILAKKPFITFGSPYTNEILLDYGFKLYDTIFDYSFDKIMDTVERAKAITDEVARVTKLYTPDYIYSELKSIAEHNYNVAIDILRNKKHIPQIFFQWDKQYSYSNIWRDHIASTHYHYGKHLDNYS